MPHSLACSRHLQWRGTIFIEALTLVTLTADRRVCPTCRVALRTGLNTAAISERLHDNLNRAAVNNQQSKGNSAVLMDACGNALLSKSKAATHRTIPLPLIPRSCISALGGPACRNHQADRIARVLPQRARDRICGIQQALLASISSSIIG